MIHQHRNGAPERDVLVGGQAWPPGAEWAPGSRGAEWALSACHGCGQQPTPVAQASALAAEAS
jgi:hypothetical protein